MAGDDDRPRSTRMVVHGTRERRFPNLFLLVLGLFLVDLIVPDFIPFLDELILGLLSVMLGLWREPRRD